MGYHVKIEELLEVQNQFFNANNFENGVRIIRKNEKNVDKNGEL